MKRTIRYYRIIWLKYDLRAGFSVFFVALPLCLGIALASGAPLYAGIISGVIGGLVVAPLSGSPLSVSGPAAGLTTIVAASIISLGDFRVFLLAVIIAGLFQVLLGLLKLGVIALYFPSSVIKGMLAGIGILLVSQQVPIVLGYDQPDFWTDAFLQLFSNRRITENFTNLSRGISSGAILVSAISLLIYMLFRLPFAKKLKVIPTPFLIVLVGVLLNFIFIYIAPDFVLSSEQLVEIPPDIFSNISLPDFTQLYSHPRIWKDGLTIGLIATLETLLCIEAVDKLDKQNRITPVNRELVAQGIGNMTCGLLGAIPITAVIVRGSANVDAGGRTKMSAFTHGAFLLLAVLFVPFLLNKIPYASLAIILIITGYNLSKPKLYRNMWSLGWKQFLPFILTILAMLATNLLTGVFIGLLLSIYFIIRGNFKEEFKIVKKQHPEKDTYLIKLNTNVTFLNKVNMRKALDQIPENSRLTIDGSECNFIDYDVLEIISEFENKAELKHIELHLIGIERVNVNAVH